MLLLFFLEANNYKLIKGVRYSYFSLELFIKLGPDWQNIENRVRNKLSTVLIVRETSLLPAALQ